jgi:hypothetical protein
VRTRRLLAVVLALSALPAAAFDRFEIQVYEPDLNEPGHLGFELHSNFTAAGARQPAYAGEIPPWHTARFTLEPALGVTPWLELGAYLETLDAPGRGVRYAGSKLRAKLLVPLAPFGEGSFLGVNVEIGRAVVEVEQDQWASEIRPFLGWQGRWLLLDLNPIFGYALSGKEAFRVALEPAAKVAVNTQLGFALGVEYYADLGFVDAILPLEDQAHYLFGVLDVVEAHGRPSSAWEINVAVGGGLTRGADQQLIVKSIIGRSF